MTLTFGKLQWFKQRSRVEGRSLKAQGSWRSRVGAAGAGPALEASERSFAFVGVLERRCSSCESEAKG